jgi:23S rRNA (adenine2030-N6)-methyltransferase
MLAYRHAFHAGNHADVLKHLVLMLVLEHQNAKPKPYRLVDTHAGPGGYALLGRQASQHGEWRHGIGRLWTEPVLPPPLDRYVALVRRFNPDGELAQYPGSPAIARELLRPIDEFRAFELHRTERKVLGAYLAGDRRATLMEGDGFLGLRSQLPPPTRRGAVLMDPSYEGHGDYAKVVATLREAVSRFAAGTYVVWYPQVSKVEARELPRRLIGLATRTGADWLHATLTVQPSDARGYGLVGSGVFVINPPHTMDAALRPVMPRLARLLGQHDRASSSLDAVSLGA